MSDQILWDCHMHSSFSVDSSTPMEDMVLKSIQQGLTGICFTEHLDPDYPDTPEKIDFSLDIPAYHKQLQTLREKYKDKLDIRFGIEIGLQPHLEDYFRQLLKEYPFDFVIGSSHIVHGADPYYVMVPIRTGNILMEDIRISLTRSFVLSSPKDVVLN